MSASKVNAKKLVEIGPGFWNLRASFTFLLGAIDVGTHLSIVRLNNGRFLVVDTCDVSASAKAEIDALTNNGSLIDAVIATHPFHTMYFTAFHKLYPNAKYYGTPRHLRNNKTVPWAGAINDDAVRTQWESHGVFIRIPECADFVNPPENNHFVSAFVYHQASRTLHDDDTIMYFSKPKFPLNLLAKDGTMIFFPDTLNGGLHPTPEAPQQFYDFIRGIVRDWDFENFAAAHTGVKLGGARAQLAQVLEEFKPKLDKATKKLAKKKQQRSPKSSQVGTV